ncbi:MAG: MucR family transcriptional regulator [Magnetococcales bacterium]|nr:MucR family transcriptional regulator [Magnetococcales bacterium]
MNLKFTAEIVQAYVANNEIASSEIPNLIQSVYRTLAILSEESGFRLEHHDLDQGDDVAKVGRGVPVDEEMRPFVDPADAVTENAVVCLICGKELKALKGHLSRTHGMDVNAYRRRFNLDADFPMVAPAYSEKRRQLAREVRLGERIRA